jgi:hypothetical protein
MSTPIAQTTQENAAREKLPPVEAVQAVAPAVSQSLTPAKSVDEGSVALGKWVHKHRNATEGLGGFLGYQIIRNSLAAIPYGVATAATWIGLEKIAVAAAAKKPDSLLAKAARSPMRDVAMIAAGFTLFRGTLKTVRYMKERLFNPNHTEEQTINEVQNFGANLKDTLREVTPAEVASTPVAAFALGYGRRFWNPAAYLGDKAGSHGVTGLFFPKYVKGELVPAMEKGKRWQHLKNVYSRAGGYWAEAAIIAASFVPFFELGDRRYKDAQVARGIWLNDPTSLVRKSDEQAAMELAASKHLLADKDNTSDVHDIVQKSAASLKATGHLRPTDAPTFSCFAMRRVVPTFLGIGAYVAGKRLAYLGMGTMTEHYNPKNWLGSLAKMAVVEGAATSLFWINSSVVDKFEPWYDKNFKDSKPKPLTDPEIRRHYAELKERLDAKERDRTGQASIA